MNNSHAESSKYAFLYFSFSKCMHVHSLGMQYKKVVFSRMYTGLESIHFGEVPFLWQKCPFLEKRYAYNFLVNNDWNTLTKWSMFYTYMCIYSLHKIFYIKTYVAFAASWSVCNCLARAYYLYIQRFKYFVLYIYFKTIVSVSLWIFNRKLTACVGHQLLTCENIILIQATF